MSKIEHDPQDPTREYIPVAGWEFQTKGNGSSYRLADVKNDERHNILGSEPAFIQNFVTRFAKDAHAAFYTLETNRSQAIAELNKALETLGQLRGDLQQAQAERDEWKGQAAILRDNITKTEITLGQISLERDEWKARAENAEEWADKHHARNVEAEAERDDAQSRALAAEQSRDALAKAARCVVDNTAEYDVGIGLPTILAIDNRACFESLRSITEAVNNRGTK